MLVPFFLVNLVLYSNIIYFFVFVPRPFLACFIVVQTLITLAVVPKSCTLFEIIF